MLKKSVAFILVIIMAMMMFGIGFADNARTSGLYTYEFKGNGTVTITGFDWKKNKDNIYIPALIDGYPVTAIGDSAFALPYDGIHYGDYVVTLSSGIVSIGDFAFQNAPVSTINIPDSLTSIGKGALAVNPDSGYIHINVAPNHSTYATIDGVLFHKTKRELVAFPTIHSRNDIKYDVPKGILSIGDYAFYYRKEGRSENWYVTIASTVKHIGEYAFADCEPSLEIEFSNSIESLGYGAFSYSKEIHPNFLTNISKTYIKNLSKLTHISTIPAYCFSDAHWTEMDENDLTSTNYVIPNNVIQIGEYAFSNAHLNFVIVREITIPGSVQRIGDHAFDNLSKSSGTYSNSDAIIVIQSGVKTIGNFAFSNIDFIESVEIEDGLESIGASAFSSCKGLKTVSVPASVTNIGKDAFDKTVTTLTVEQGSYAEHYAIENGIQFKYYETTDDLSWLTGGEEDSSDIDYDVWMTTLNEIDREAIDLLLEEGELFGSLEKAEVEDILMALDSELNVTEVIDYLSVNGIEVK